MKKVMNKIWMIALLTIVSTVAWAQDDPSSIEEKPKVRVDLNDSYSGGTIEVTKIADPAEDGSIEVTITVTPDEGYKIAKSDITVVATVSTGTREGTPTIAGTLDLKGDDPEKLTDKRDYSFVVPSGFGAWVKEANFRKAEASNDISGDGNSNVTWSKSEDNTTITITGDGSTAGFDAGSAPWASISDQITSVVIEKGVTSLGANLFAGCTSLTSITIDNAEQVLGIGEGAVPANEGLKVTVPGNLLTEYNITDGWKDFTMGSENVVRMDNIKFSSNEYDTFVASETIMVPSVLKAYTITGINGTRLELKEVTVITPGMAVLVYNAKDIPSDVTIYTAPTTSETKGGGGLLKVAPEGGQDVKLGDAYILYNDVFYYSQAGTIPEGKVYLTATEEMRTRGSYSLHDNGTTAIDSVYNNKVETPTPWYGLDGHQYTTMPTRKGIYIKDGKKMILRN